MQNSFEFFAVKVFADEVNIDARSIFFLVVEVCIKDTVDGTSTAAAKNSCSN